MRQLILSAFTCLLLGSAFSQQTSRPASSEIKQELEKLLVVGNVMYFAAHPDDENTRLIAWLAQGQKYRTSYFSLTRGGGGQNLIGDEKGEMLGILRSQELQMARSIDGGEQYFSRAMDFGYSKSVDEVFEKWNKDSLVADAVSRIRQFKPDVIVTRFPPDERAGHGQHTASAIVAEEAFEAANDPNKFPASAKKYGIWKVHRLFFNTHAWFDKSIDEKKDKLIVVNVGDFNPLLGESYTEIASKARSQHRCQAFGTALQRGDRPEYLELVKGDPLVDKKIFDGIVPNWSRIRGGYEVQDLLVEINNNFDYSDPSKSIEGLALVLEMIDAMPDFPWKEQKQKDVVDIMKWCAGIHTSFTTLNPKLVVGSQTPVELEVVVQGQKKMFLKEIRVHGKTLEANQSISNTITTWYDTLAFGKRVSQPYWLEDAVESDMYQISNKNLLGLPENPPIAYAEFVFETPYLPLIIREPIQYAWVDRSIGELQRPVAIIPPVSSQITNKVYLFANDSTQEIKVRIKAHRDMAEVKVSPNLPKGWNALVQDTTIKELKNGQVYEVGFQIAPPKKSSQGYVSIALQVGSEVYTQHVQEIAYDHIPTQVVLPPTKAKLVKEDIQIAGANIGYIMGSGDEIPQALSQLGYAVTLIEPKNVTLAYLQEFDAVISGIRAYNRLDEITEIHEMLLEYVRKGGKYVVQYNTSYSLKTEELGPYPLKIGRGRVTDEFSEVRLLQKDHPILNYPNNISHADFEGWVQERGLYFAKEWDEQYTSLISWNDKGANPELGGLLVAEYGEGAFVYTGISFFRELPAGVPGAFKLFANIIAQVQATEEENE